MKSRLLINTVSHPLFTAKLSPKNASSFALPRENLRMSHPCFKNNSWSKNSRRADCRDLPDMWRHSAAAETRSDARIKTNFLFLVHELNC